MANTTLTRTGRRWYVGPQGNLSVSPAHIATLSAVPAADVITFGDNAEKNIRISAVQLITGALGASTTLTVKVGGVTLVSAKATASAVSEIIPVDDVLTGEGEAITLTVGGGTASGDVKVKFWYEVVGNL
ncbi:hypothetical protein HNR62_001036 [Oceanisphaera litoralis]|uniref:hypothetical protein n=1 Tax=Oceanisphaera litoralis TaxID=225144 RepID=UPI00195D107E|nr:hypothetical protein [Oceanisphaera litoralis]MBM7455176.1 hypothetical protein [Oceanisphaera litoralis]